MMRRLDGKVAIVTGSGGIGAATAMRLASEGAQVVIADIDLAGAEATARAIVADGGAAIPHALDLGDEASIAALMATVETRFARLDVLHNNAAATAPSQMGRDMAITSMDADIWDNAFRINTRGTMLMIKHAIPLMLRGGGGSIVNTSSGAALRGDLYGPAYAASKAAINCLTLYVATQYGKQGIRCNVVSPGLIVTQNVRDNIGQEQLDRIETHKLTPFLGAPEDIAAAVAYLASDDARFVTAQVHVVDGGIIDHMPYFAEVYGNFVAAPAQRFALIAMGKLVLLLRTAPGVTPEAFATRWRDEFLPALLAQPGVADHLVRAVHHHAVPSGIRADEGVAADGWAGVGTY